MSKRKSNPPVRTIPESSSSSDDRAVNRGMLYATWAGAIVSLIAVVSSLVFFFVTKGSEKEVFVFTSVQRITIAHAELKPFVDVLNKRATDNATGILSSYWRVFLSNNSDKDISIVSYSLSQVSSEDYPAISYSAMDQGLYVVEDNEVKPLSLPLSITSGATIPVFVKIGVIMEPEEYHFVIDKFGERTQYEMQDIESFLRREHETDIYGNFIELMASGVSLYPSLENIREQIFAITFETARGTKSTGLASWYVYSGFFDQYTQPQSP